MTPIPLMKHLIPVHGVQRIRALATLASHPLTRTSFRSWDGYDWPSHVITSCKPLSSCRKVTSFPFHTSGSTRKTLLSPVIRRHASSASGHKREVVQFRLSDIGEGIAEVNIKEWYVTVGQTVSQFDSICEVQSDKASVTITSKFDGVIRKLHYDVDDMAKVGQPLVDIEIMAGEASTSDLVDEMDDQDTRSSTADSYKKSLAAPAVRRIAMENNVDLSQVPGSGKDGRVMKEDVVRFLEASRPKTTTPDATQSAGSVTPSTRRTVTASFSSLGSVASPPVTAASADQVVKMSPITRAMFKSMTQSLGIPHLGLSDDVNVDRVIGMKGLLQERGITFLSLFLKATSHALIDFPVLNSCIADASDGELLLKGDHNIGFAMDTPVGLLVPNIKRVQDKSIFQISQEIKRLMEDGRNNRAKQDDLTGGTFTLSNVGSIGGTFGIPVILPPQVAIGALGRIQTRPAFASDDRVIKSHVIQVVWSADHRVIDGATIARFSNRWKSLIQEPDQLLLELR